MSYIGQEVRQSRVQRTTFTAVGGETTASVKYTPGQLSVYLNGIKLQDAIDYIATDGETISELEALEADDVLDMVGLDTFLSSDTVPASTGGIFNNRVTFQGAMDNPTILLGNITAPVSYSTALIGPVSVPNLTVNGNLTVMAELDVSGNTSITTGGSLNIIG
tara:strand:- start:496 stop:984 length:489 start_codon:yes stop_codon:yes gene_type:complete